MPPIWEWLTDAALADSIAGDLEEQWRARARRSRTAANLWLLRRSVALAWFFLRAKARVWAGRFFRNGPAGPGGLCPDVRYSLRSLRHSPWYAFTVVAVVALGVSLSTTVFAVVDGVLFKPLPYPAADRLIAIEPGFRQLPPASPTASASAPRRINAVSALDVANWRLAVPEAQITAFRAQGWGGLGEAVNESAYGVASVERNFFDTIGVRPVVGGFNAADFDHDELVFPVVITHDLWQSRFHGMPDVIGQRYIGDPTKGSGFRVAGVMPEGFVFPSALHAVSMIRPFVLDSKRAYDPQNRGLFEVIARLPVPADRNALERRLEAGSLQTASAFGVRGPKPQGWSDRGWAMQGPYDQVTVSPLSNRLGRSERPLFGAVFIAAVLLLVIGGLNISGLMTARGLDRERELALRRALGASSVLVARLVFIEALLPISAGAVAGLALATQLLHIGARLLPEELLLFNEQPTVGIDARAWLFVIISAIAIAALTSIWPIRRALRPAPALSAGSRGSARSRSFGRSVVVASQVGAALVLTVGGALLVGSILAVYSHRPPIRTDGVVSIGMTLVGPGVTMGKLSPERNARMNALIETIRRVPGVQAAALTDAQILVGGSGYTWFAKPPGVRSIDVDMQSVTPDFYRVLEPQVVIGRLPTDEELATDAPVIVVSESLARGYWPKQSPIGQTLERSPDKKPFTVVGVVKDVRWTGWDEEIASVYGPYAELSHFPFPMVFIRTSMSASQTFALVSRAVAAADPLITMDRAGTLSELFRESVRQRRFQSWLFGSFAIAALVIVGAGVLGLTAMSTARRSREMGIRLALGSTREGLVRLILGEQLRAVTAGIVFGSAVSFWAVRFLKAYLYQVTPYDGRIWSFAVLVIIATTMIGTLVPSLRASQADPVKALRIE